MPESCSQRWISANSKRRDGKNDNSSRIFQGQLLTLIQWSSRHQTKAMGRVIEYASNIAWIAAERVIRIVISVFLLAYIARYLGPEQFGLLNYAVAIVALGVPLIALGLNRLLVRELVRTNAEGELLGTVFSLKLAASVTSVVALALVSLYSGWVAEEAALLIIVAALGNLFMAFDVVDFYSPPAGCR